MLFLYQLFTINTIVAITCPNIYPKPFQTVVCPNGTSYGSMCNITCEEGTKMHGPDVVICERKDEEMFGHWTWGENQTYCEGALCLFLM